MADSDQRQLQEINQIAESLSSNERRTLSYLCESLDSDSSVARVKETLKGKVRCHQDAQLLLSELMLRLGRFDVLRKLYKLNRNDVERTLRYTQTLSEFRVLMANVSENLVKEDLDGMKFLLGNTLSREKIENAENFLDVIIELEKLDLVSPERVDMVETCLNNIGRLDLAKKVTSYKRSVQTPDPVSPSQQSCQVSVHRSLHTQCLVRGNTASPAGRERSSQSSRESYKFNANPRGVCVIIDCVGNDGGILEETFKALHFNVTLHQWLSVGDMHSVLTDISRQSENYRGDGFVCCIISRGATDYLLGTDLYGRGLSMSTVRRLFTAEACPSLAGKPKLFFIQRYSTPGFVPQARMEYRDEDLETDGRDIPAPRDFVATDADVFWSHCWTEAHELEKEAHHSIYLKALSEALRKCYRRQTNIVDVHTEVNRAIFEHNRRNPGANYHIDVRHTLTKNVYLD
ncbi:unnamed protein product [Ophioblennius macclurei]